MPPICVDSIVPSHSHILLSVPIDEFDTIASATESYVLRSGYYILIDSEQQKSKASKKKKWEVVQPQYCLVLKEYIESNDVETITVENRYYFVTNEFDQLCDFFY